LSDEEKDEWHMNSRERVIAALQFSGPDRVPVMHRTLPGAFRVHGEKLTALYERYPSDVMLSPTSNAPFAFNEMADTKYRPAGRWIDPWGFEWLKLSDDWQGQVVGHPLSDWAALGDYQWIDPMIGYEGIEEMVQVMKEDRHQHYYLGYCGSLFHHVTFLRGFEETMVDLALGNEEILFVRDKVAEITIKRIEAITKAGADGVLIADDWGTQRALYIKPAMWRELFKPTYKKLVDAIHEGGAYAHFHTDGVTRDILPDLIEIGFNELNPQVWIMDVDELSRKFKGKVCIRADLDRQFVLREGTPEEVTEHVRKTHAAFGLPSGGYIGYGQIGPDTPIENAETMLRTFYELKP
jgi:uroporphyrinogen-III decarboxylase